MGDGNERFGNAPGGQALKTSLAIFGDNVKGPGPWYRRDSQEIGDNPGDDLITDPFGQSTVQGHRGHDEMAVIDPVPRFDGLSPSS